MQRAKDQLRSTTGTQSYDRDSKDTSSADYAFLIKNAPYGIFIATPDGRFVTVNAALVKMLGYRSQKELTTSGVIRDLFADHADREGLHLPRGRFVNREWRWRRRDGTPILVRASGEFFKAAGQKSHWRVMIENITAQRTFEEQARQKQKIDALALLMGGASHDFNTLLTAILGYAELLFLDNDLSEMVRHRVEGIVVAALEARSITQQLLLLGRRGTVEPTVIHLNAFLLDLESLLRRLTGNGVNIVFSLTPEPVDVRINATQLTRVIINLACNARDAMSRGGTFSVTTSVVENFEDDSDLQDFNCERLVLLSFADTGCGMDEKTQCRIFEPFFTTKPEGKGTGVGLSIVQEIIAEAAGKVRIASRSGEGTTVQLFLPAALGGSTDSEKRSEPQRTVNGCETILIVDDHDVARNISRDILVAHGYDVLTAKSGTEALATAKQYEGPIHLLITDIVLPKLSGPDLAKECAKLRPEMKLMYMTAYADVLEVAALVGNSQCEMLRKPYMCHELMSRVRHALGAGNTQ